MFFPYSTDRELQRIPWATIGLIALNVLVAVLTLANPELLSALALNSERFAWWQPLTAMFAHAGIMHLVSNMVILWVFGTHVEDTIGVAKYLLLYLSAGLAADVLQATSDVVFYHTIQGGLGASGAIMGLVALFCTRFKRVKVNFFYWWYMYAGTVAYSAFWVAIVYIGYETFQGLLFGVSGLSSGIGHFAHIGGFLGGLAWSYGLRLPDAASADEAREDAAKWATVGAFEAAALPLEAELLKHPYNPDLHLQAARYLTLKPQTQSRGIDHYHQALRLLVAEKRYEEAGDCWRKMRPYCRVGDIDPESLYRVGVELEHSGDLAQASAAYDGVVRSHQSFPQAPAVALRMADLAARCGHQESAREWYTYLQQTWPNSPEALEAGGRLQALGRQGL